MKLLSEKTLSLYLFLASGIALHATIGLSDNAKFLLVSLFGFYCVTEVVECLIDNLRKKKRNEVSTGLDKDVLKEIQQGLLESQDDILKGVAELMNGKNSSEDITKHLQAHNNQAALIAKSLTATLKKLDNLTHQAGFKLVN